MLTGRCQWPLPSNENGSSTGSGRWLNIPRIKPNPGATEALDTRIILAPYGVPESTGAEAATDIPAEFAKHRPWHRHGRCSWDSERLVLQADNDFDSSGLALRDEFSDVACAYVTELFDSGIEVKSVVKVSAGA